MKRRGAEVKSGQLPAVFVVDDEPDVRAYLAAVLEDAGYRVRAFASSEGVVDAARAERPGAVCVDLVMPGRGGLALLRALRAQPGLEGLPVLLVSGLPEGEAAALCRAQGLGGPIGWLEKPVSPEGLLGALGALLGGAAAEGNA